MEQGVTIFKTSGNDNEYIIRDKSGINIGRFEIIDLDEINKRCNINFKFYRKKDNDLLNETLRLILRVLYKNPKINKVNIFMPDDINLSVFLDIGFSLEGIFIDNLYIQGELANEISMGITRKEYNSGSCLNLLKLEGKKITLKILMPNDDDDMLDFYIRNKKHLENFEPNRDNIFYTKQVQHNILTESYRQYLNGSALDFGIYKNEKLIGKIRLSNIVYGIFKSGIIGYSIDKDEQGKGYMKDAVSTLTKYAFEELDLHRVEASTLTDNEKSKRVLLGCGFKMLGVNEDYLYINGKWQDHITFYKIK
ncbi:MAG: GNAT family protein [Clostridiales bacterium]|nr:GNAT family protein [Clostridiales bacterium]MDY2729133.1 GNAT family protein [Clostridium sp.]